MELHPQEELPGAQQLVPLRRRLPLDEQRVGGELLRRQQQVLGPAVHPLDAGLRGVGAAGEEVQLALVHGEGVGPGFQQLEVLLRGRVDELRRVGRRAYLLDPLEVSVPRSAAVIACAEEHHRVAEVGSLTPLDQLVDELLADRHTVVARKAIDQHARPVGGFPPEAALIARCAPHRDVVLQPGLAEDLREVRVVPERVRRPGDVGVDAQPLARVALGHERLADQRLTAGQVHVGLGPHPPDDDPSPLADSLGDPLEKLRVEVLGRLVQRELRVGEGHVGVSVHLIEDALVGVGGRVVDRLRPAPPVGEVEMGVPDEVNRELIRPRKIAPLVAAGVLRFRRCLTALVLARQSVACTHGNAPP